MKCGGLVTRTLVLILSTGVFAKANIAQQPFFNQSSPLQPQLFVIDARHPLNMAVLTTHFPVPIPQALGPFNQASPPIIMSLPVTQLTSPASSQAVHLGNNQNTNANVLPAPVSSDLQPLAALSQASPPVITPLHVTQITSPESLHSIHLATADGSSVNGIQATGSSDFLSSPSPASQNQREFNMQSLAEVSEVTQTRVSQEPGLTASQVATPEHAASQGIPIAALLSTLAPLSNVNNRDAPSVQQPQVSEVPASENEDSSLSQSQPIPAASQSSDVNVEATSDAANLPVPSTTESPQSSVATIAPQPFDTTENAVNISFVDAETTLDVTDPSAVVPQIAVTTAATDEITTEISTASEVEPVLSTTPPVPTSDQETPLSNSISPSDDQNVLPSSQFSARTALVSDSTLPEELSSSDSNVTAEAANTFEVTAVLEDESFNPNLIRDSVMPNAEEATARRFETIARTRSSQETFTSSGTGDIPESLSSTVVPTASGTTAAAATSPSPPTVATSTPAPATEVSVPTAVPSSAGIQAVPTLPNNVSSVAQFFQSISRAAVRNVEKIAALARSRSLGFGVEPIVVRSPEGAEGNDAVGVVHQSPEGMHMTISNAGDEDHHHRQIHNHQGLVTEMMGTHAVSPAS